MKWNNLSLQQNKMVCSFIVVLLPFFCSISNIFQKYLAVTLWAIMMWMFELLPEEIVAIMLPGLYILFDITNYATAFSALDNQYSLDNFGRFGDRWDDCKIWLGITHSL